MHIAPTGLLGSGEERSKKNRTKDAETKEVLVYQESLSQCGAD